MRRDEMTTYNKFSRNAAGEISKTSTLVKMNPYVRRGLYPHKGSDAVSLSKGIFWSNETGASEGVAIARFIP